MGDHKNRAIVWSMYLTTQSAPRDITPFQPSHASTLCDAPGYSSVCCISVYGTVLGHHLPDPLFSFFQLGLDFVFNCTHVN